MKARRIREGLVEVVRFMAVIVVYVVTLVVALPVLASIRAYWYFSGQRKLGSRKTWGDRALRESYHVRRLEIGAGWDNISMALWGIALWVLLVILLLPPTVLGWLVLCVCLLLIASVVASVVAMILGRGGARLLAELEAESSRRQSARRESLAGDYALRRVITLYAIEAERFFRRSKG